MLVLVYVAPVLGEACCAPRDQAESAGSAYKRQRDYKVAEFGKSWEQINF